MATYDLEEQEQLDQLKAWWKRWGSLTLAVLAVVVAAAAGWRYWQLKQETQRQESAAIYGKLTQTLKASDMKTAREVGAALISQYPDTPYATRAALLLGKLEAGSKDGKAAEAQFAWAIAHTKEPALKDLATLRLAGVMLDEKKYDDALKQLDSVHTDAFGFRFDDLRGDVQMAQNKLAGARKSYQAAMKKMDADNPYRKVVDLKLDSLGGAIE
jgi:predicted negative regulator of RcsB-dependent stress response